MSHSPSSAVLGIDIGGANIKLSDGLNFSRHEPFALWQQPNSLASKLRTLISHAPTHEQIAITMTGELTDCFANKRDGVSFILKSISQATEATVLVYLLDGRFVKPETAEAEYELAAASNWHALAKQVASTMVGGQPGMLIDIGSTTTDLIPFNKGAVLTVGLDDFGRLTNHELVYTAAIRTSIAGILHRIWHRGMECPLMNEMFATTLDTNIVLEHIPEETQTHYAADGKPTGMVHCVRRLARLIGKDELTFDYYDARELAGQVFDAQIEMICNAARKVLCRHEFHSVHFVTSGQGEFLAKAVVEKLLANFDNVRSTSLAEALDPGLSNCATAWSIANLANEQLNAAALSNSLKT